MIKKNTLAHAYKACNKFTLNLLFITLLSFSSFAQVNGNSVSYFEDFTSIGYPANAPTDAYWTFYNEIHPTQDTWDKFIPGDGNAYITVDTDTSNDLDWIHPFQSLIFGGVAENHRLEVRMKGAVVDGGLVSFLFTYEQQGSTFNEVDLELVARDLAVPSHPTLPENGGWTDARFNTWRNANENTNSPFTGTKKAIVNQQDEKISLIDNKFHIYTIDWRSNKIDFFIDGVLQETITTNIATGKAEVIFGFRQLPWAGAFNWTGTHTMVIDYLKIEPLEEVTVAADDYYVVIKDTATDLNVLFNDSAGTTITSYDQVSAQGQLISGTSTLLTYTPSGGFTGQDSFTYTITDQNGLTATATVDIYIEYVEPVNGVAEAKGDAITVAQNTTSSLNVLADNGSGADDFGTDGAADNGLTFLNGTLTGLSEQGTIVVDTKGTDSPLDDDITYTPKAGFTGVDHFYYMITDASGDASIAQVAVTVTEVATPSAVNDALSILQDSGLTSIDVLSNDSFGLNGAHPTESLTIDISTITNGATIIVNIGKVEYTPQAGFLGADSFEYVIKDANDIESRATVTITVGPIVSSGLLEAKNDAVTVTQNSGANQISILLDNGSGADSYGTNGPNTNHPISLSSFYTNVGSELSLNASTGIVSYTPRTGFIGIDTFNYTITDANGNGSTATVTVTVTSAALVLSAVNDSASAIKNSTVAKVIDVLANDSFGTAGAHPTESLTINASTNINGAIITVVNGKVTYTPATDFTGQDTFTYTIKDANDAIATATVTVIVNNVIVNPVNGVAEAKGDAITVAQNTTSSLNVLADNGSGADDFGTDGAADNGLTFLNGTLSGLSEQGTIVVDTKGTDSPLDDDITYTPKAGFTGVDHFYYMITDASGDASIAQVAVTVTEVATPSAVNDALSILQDSGLTSIDVLSNDSFGLNGAHPTESLTIDISTITNGATIIVNIGKVEYTPQAGFLGTDSFEYVIKDANDIESRATVTITVGPIVSSGLLEAKNDAVTVTQNSGANQISILLDNGSGADSYGTNGPNTNHPISLSSFYTNVGSELSLNASTGIVSYTPRTGFIGIDTFNYTITDANGNGSTATVTVTVTSAALVLSAVNDSASAIKNSTVAKVIDVLANDSFGTAGAHPTESLTINASTNINGAIITVVNGKVTYTPATDFTGQDTFTYTIKDVNDDTATATVTVTVETINAVNGIAIAKGDAITVAQNTTISLDVLVDNGSGADDFGTDGAADNGLTFLNGTLIGVSEQGTIEVDTKGTDSPLDDNITYTPKTDFTGVDHFYYMITDASGDTSIAQVAVTVQANASVAKTLGVADNNTSLIKELEVYPNPSKGNFNVLVYSDKAELASIILYDITGKVVYNNKLLLISGQNKVNLNVNVKSGIMFLKMYTTNQNLGTKKIKFN